MTRSRPAGVCIFSSSYIEGIGGGAYDLVGGESLEIEEEEDAGILAWKRGA